eukprot:jgi/Pico_ML_1/53644/g4153.t1
MADGIRRVAREGIKEVLKQGKADSVVWMIALIVVFVSISPAKPPLRCPWTKPITSTSID